jgi:hypothetical protein
MSESDLERAVAIFAARVPGSKCRLIEQGARIRCTAASRPPVEVIFASDASDAEMRRKAEMLDLLSG